MDIKVTVGNNTNRKTVIVANTLTPKQVFVEQGIDYSKGQAMLDGSMLQRDELNKPLVDLIGTAETAMLFSVVKTDNAL